MNKRKKRKYYKWFKTFLTQLLSVPVFWIPNPPRSKFDQKKEVTIRGNYIQERTGKRRKFRR
jgi:hypothetical protein